MAGSRRLAAIMFTDIVGFVRLTQADESRALELLERHNEILRAIFPRFQGREVKAIGDSFLVEFSSALDATRCAIEIQRSLEARNLSAPSDARFLLRIGLHVGDVISTPADVLGDAVNIAARMEPLAEPGGICLSEQVFAQVHNKIPERFVKLEPKVLKNVDFPMDVYRLALGPRDIGPAGVPARRRLAVLPLANISAEPKDEYFADGLTEELISVLSKIRDLRVIARTSIGQYKSTSKSVAQIASELGVNHLLEGSVRKAGNRIRVTMQLIDGISQEHVWAETYNRELDDVFSIQTEIAEETARALRLELVGPEREALERRPTSNIAAYNLYLKGLHAAHQPADEATFAESIRWFEAAIREDPTLALAHAHLANVFTLLAGQSMPSEEGFARARELVARALALDDLSSEAHAARGNLALQDDLDWALAEAEFRRALQLNPSSTAARYWRALLLATLQRFPESKEELRTTIELDPLWPQPRRFISRIHLYSGDLDAAIQTAEEERSRDPTRALNRAWLGVLYALAGRREDALREAEESSGPVSDFAVFFQACLGIYLDRPELARKCLRDWEERSPTRYVAPLPIAGLYASLGEIDQALAVIEENDAEGRRNLWFYYQLPAFDRLRDHPRFLAMLRESHLPLSRPPRVSAPGPGGAAGRGKA